MKQLLLNWLLKDITRFEVINHNSNKYTFGRCLVHSKGVGTDYIEYQVNASLQDDNKTLKIFI